MKTIEINFYKKTNPSIIYVKVKELDPIQCSGFIPFSEYEKYDKFVLKIENQLVFF